MQEPPQCESAALLLSNNAREGSFHFPKHMRDHTIIFKFNTILLVPTPVVFKNHNEV